MVMSLQDPKVVSVVIKPNFVPTVINPVDQIAQVIPIEAETQIEQGICINWAQKVTLDRPIIECTLLSPNSGQQKSVSGLLDTGADLTIISAKDWPSTWGTTKPAVDIQGVGGSKTPLRSILPLLVQGPQGAGPKWIPSRLVRIHQEVSLPAQPAADPAPTDSAPTTGSDPSSASSSG
ncbi:PREDICTED: endogenous retrovirus group K member 9 Pol protein-like [Lepidothrix coronata]|uniref:Endogenous retrovirus group K member 9 Pol protein-like n=1 Tax=Lepidothrix coronata TaxID=321398 RepID=A0A6J0IR26_9PASS|nr:PREDICTED: endogenous retrovirus group K member 9 Pol protein-like [Lepidothrix coronata]